MFNDRFRQFTGITGIIGLVGSITIYDKEINAIVSDDCKDCIIAVNPWQVHIPSAQNYFVNTIEAITAVSTADAVSTSEVRLSDQTSSRTNDVQVLHPALER